MVQASPPSPLREEDYEAIEAAVMETARGRWFLSEFAQRNRSADTNVLLDAIQKLDKSMRRERKGPQINRIQLDLADMQEAITRTKQEIAQIKHESDDGDRFTEASNELDAIISQTEGATQDILNTTEKIQELAWTLREQGIDEKVCDDIDAHTTDIYMACSFQDLTGQRTQKVVQVLRYLESRINEMMEIWGLESDDMDVERAPTNQNDARPDAHLLNGPQLENKGINQNDIDALMDFSAAADPDAAVTIEHDADEITPHAEESGADPDAMDVATAADVADDAPDASTETVDFTFGRTDDDAQADVFAPEAAADESAPDATTDASEDVMGADVFASGDINATLAEMVGADAADDTPEIDPIDEPEAEGADIFAAADDAAEDISGDADDDMSAAVSELTTDAARKKTLTASTRSRRPPVILTPRHKRKTTPTRRSRNWMRPRNPPCSRLTATTPTR
ncbi:protein phosphatase CheZ [Breoghania sp. L-A4]|uniref:protein phosphatase CheZ n=1 Tax=Breoghania sp. L-A4 TaxID=2304600 RepID=UPI000E35A67F|nr:protein phosphatase CheZ [Breoghania sp. L-A4]AXS41249.1 chemotaxis protein [Breoghania sp. L-A4]